jgi:DNA uptake protein ComE-like DNA-binding protein
MTMDHVPVHIVVDDREKAGGKVLAVMTASADDLATVDGIGEKTAAKMRRIIEEPAAGFGVTPRVR